MSQILDALIAFQHELKKLGLPDNFTIDVSEEVFIRLYGDATFLQMSRIESRLGPGVFPTSIIMGNGITVTSYQMQEKMTRMNRMIPGISLL